MLHLKQPFFLLVLVFFYVEYLFAGKTTMINTKLHAFWRNEPVIGRWLSSGQGLIKIPKYMKNNSFPYLKDISRLQVPFADGLSVVRLLGGWDYRKKHGTFLEAINSDLAYIDKGQLKYRWRLLKKRLDPYIDAGYSELTLVLDNTPWGLTKKGKLGPYGQINPPSSMKIWGKFIENMCVELIRIYGVSTVKHFRFRIGTENQSRRRFNGSFMQYLDMYLTAQNAILKVLPDAKIGPFNFAGGKEEVYKKNINMSRFISLLKHSSRNQRPKVSFLPISTYFIVREGQENNIKYRMDAVMNANNHYYNVLFHTAGKTFPKEIQEFGILNNIFDHVFSDEPGVRGAAWRMYMIDKMIEQNVTKLYHWNTFDKVAKDKYLLKGNGWLYAVLDHLEGGQAHLLSVVTDNDSCYRTFLVKKNSNIYLLTTAFPLRGDESFSKNITLHIPSRFLPDTQPISTEWSVLDQNSSVLDVLHRDLLKKGLLRTPFLKDKKLLGRVNKMTTEEGRRYIVKHWHHYEKIISNSLTLKKFPLTLRNREKIKEIYIYLSDCHQLIL